MDKPATPDEFSCLNQTQGTGDVLSNLLSLHEGTSTLVALYDEEDRLRYANCAFRAAFHIDEDELPLWAELMRRNYQAGVGTVICARDFDGWLISTQSRRGKVGFRAFETDLCDGRWLWMTETVQRNGWMLCIASDITSLRTDVRTLRQDRDFAVRASQTDELTGVANRRYVMERLADMLQASDREQGRGCIAILDVDHFKHINDTYGHQTGDIVLCDFARSVQSQVRRADCVGRIGGEEFLLVLPHATLAEATTVLERMLTIIRNSRPLQDQPDFTYTFSAGVAVCCSGDTTADIYARADKALYGAKLGGRDRVCVDRTASDLSAAAE
jgi:diguanylate cyclase (GGDEF)-like protein